MTVFISPSYQIACSPRLFTEENKLDIFAFITINKSTKFLSNDNATQFSEYLLYILVIEVFIEGLYHFGQLSQRN